MARNLVLNAAGDVVDVVNGIPPAEAYAFAFTLFASTPELEASGVWVGWRRQDGIFIPPGGPELPPTVVDLMAYASDARWRLEVGGTVWNGWPVATDDRSKTLVNGELNAIALSVRQNGEPFKFADGIPRPLTNAQMQAVAIAMRAHVTLSFRAMFSVQAGIQGGTVTTNDRVDAELAAAIAAQP